MAKKKTSSLLSSYRKKRRSSRSFVMILAGLLILAGLVLIGLWATGNLGGGGLALFHTKTPTPTATLTPTPVTPTATYTITPTPSLTPTITPTGTPDGPFPYEVKAEDTCWSIYEAHNVRSMQLFLQLNGLDQNCVIREGQTILIPAPWQEMPTATPWPSDIPRGTIIDYVAEEGASLRSIAQYFYSSVERILVETNRYRQTQGLPLLTDLSSLQIGDLIKVPVNIVTPTPTAAPTATTAPPTPTP
jgi:LysM repeat protein